LKNLWKILRAPDLLRTAIYSKTMLVSQGLNLVTVSLIIGFIGNKNYGIYQYGLGVVGTALLFGLLGTDSVSFREFSMPLRHASAALPRVLLMRISGSLASLAFVAGLLKLGWVKLPFDLFLAVSATSIAESFLRIGMAWHRARHLAWTDFWTSSSRSLAILVFVVLIIPGHRDAMGIAMAYGAGSVVILASLLWQWRRILWVGWKSDFLWKRLSKATPKFFVIDIIGNATGLIPALLLGHLRLFSELGRYSIYVKYLGPFALVSGLYIQSLQPTMVRAFHKGEAVAPLFRRGTKVIALSGLVGFCASATLGSILVASLGHQRPVDFVLIFVIAVFNAVVSAGAFVDSVLVASRSESLVLFSHIAGFLVCGGCSVILVRFGAEGMALAVFAATLAKLVISAWNLARNVEC